MNVVYPNQKVAEIHKEPTDKVHVYGVFNKDALMASLRELLPNELKVFIYLASNQDGFVTALSTEHIAEVTGANKDGVRVAIRGLIEKGYLVKNYGNYYDFNEVPQWDEMNDNNWTVEKKPSQLTGKVLVANGKSSVYPEENQGEIIHETTLNSTEDYRKKDLSKDILSEFDVVFGRNKVDCHKHTIRKLEEVAGTSIEPRVLSRIVDYNWPAFEKGMDQQEGYRFNTLVNITRDQYRKWDHVIATEDAEFLCATEQARNAFETKQVILNSPEVNEAGVEEISKLLNNMFGNVS